MNRTGAGPDTRPRSFGVNAGLRRRHLAVRQFREPRLPVLARVEPVPAAQLLRGEGVLEHRPAVVAAQLVLGADLAQCLVVLHHARPHLLPAGRRALRPRQRFGEHGLTDPQFPDLPHHRAVLALFPQALEVRHRGHVHLRGRRRGPQLLEGLLETGPELRHRSHRRSRRTAGVVRAHHHRDQAGLVLRGRGQLPRQVRHPRAGHRVVPAARGHLGLPEQPRRGDRTAGSLPVAQDTSGQSASTEQASKPRVMESPTAATEAGAVFQRGAAAFGVRSLPGPGSAESQPVTVAARTATATPAPATVRRTLRRGAVVRIAWSLPRRPASFRGRPAE